MAETNDRHSSTVLVPVSNMEDFEKRLADLNKKAVRFGLDPITTTSQNQQRYYYDVKNEGRDGDIVSKTLIRLKEGKNPPKGQSIVLVNSIDIEYPIIKLGSWQVMAQLESVGLKGQNLVFSIVGDQISEPDLIAYSECPLVCEHCNTSRQRKLSYILKDTVTEDSKQVGSTCLEDFTGVNPAAALFMAKLYDFVKVVDYSDDLEGGSFSGAVSAIATEEYLASVAFIIEKAGFVSSQKAKDEGVEPTYRLAMSINLILQRDPAFADEYWGAHDRLRTVANEVIEWYAAKQPDGSFERNVKLLLAEPDILIDPKHMAFAAAAIPSYHRHQKKLLDEKRSLTNPSQHVGEKGEKRLEAVTLEKLIPYDTQYGTQYRVNMTDAEGNKLSWKTANPPQELREIGSVGHSFTAQFKIKDHTEFRGSLTTEVSHLKFKEWVNELNVVPKQGGSSEFVLLNIENTQSSAFADLGLEAELHSIVAQAISRTALGWDGSEIRLSDTNSNPVGYMRVTSLPMDSFKTSSGICVGFPLDDRFDERLNAVAKSLVKLPPDSVLSLQDDLGELVAQAYIGSEVFRPVDPQRYGVLDDSPDM